jgi:uncharacterized membrane protein HdeD (DUF308 family)
MKSSINQVVVEIKIIETTAKKSKPKKMSIIERMQAPTPKFFRVLRNVGLCLVAAGGVLVATPIAIPAAIVALGGYLIVAGSVATAVAQTAVEKNNK